ncbi:MAG: hypothetical protein K2L07_04230 [Lachnospiraceae bacterium]|nr:hypothetical protein [Lachnospiraceae bacterium]
MSNKELKKYLRQYLQQETELEKEHNKEDVKKHIDAKLEETVKLCTEIMREQKLTRKSQEEPRIGFVQYLADIFRFEGVPIFGLQAVSLFIICVAIYTIAGNPCYIPAFMPLFVLAVMPAMFKCQYYGMSEIEAVTRASGSQIVLAKLVLAGAANLVCMTFFISFEVHLQNSCREIGQIILYCMVPYLVCMVSMLRLIRLCRKENMQICTVTMFSSCVCWGVLARTLPWLYDASAFGIWIIAFLFFAAFFIKEIYFIITMRKEGKTYGIIA